METLNYLCDTSVLIEYLRGNTAIQKRLLRDKAGGLAIPTIAIMELLVGTFNQNEIRLIKKTFKDYRVIEIDETVSTLARNFIESYARSHGLLIPDALIAATAITRKLPLFTLNRADFQFIPQLKLF
ncbi:MAG: type II toxin-antitoxin system VapC family toxin [Spirochaetaceae bacterium]|nr:type II toxin-antitoxin system VapC family toxin [Spirochaetaceae bacterium]